MSAPRPGADAPPPGPRLALRTAAAVTAVAAVAALAAAVLPLPRLAATAAVALVAGAAAYAVVRTRVVRRLALARAALRDARRRRFESLSGLETAAGGDEVDGLLDQVYLAGRTLEQEIERLEKLENYRREFLGDVSHELRTPIFAISGFAEGLLDGALDDPLVRRRFVEKILANARRLDALTGDLAELSRIETGELQMRPAPFDLRALARETVEALEPLAAERRVALAVSVPAGLPPVVGDRARLHQVLANLVENAVKYNAPGGRVEVTAAPGDGAVRVAVVDDGIGIPAAQLPRLTERFYRVDKSRSRHEGGTGLGLAIVKHILEAHGERLDVESRLGAGSTFAFSLPAARGGERALA